MSCSNLPVHCCDASTKHLVVSRSQFFFSLSLPNGKGGLPVAKLSTFNNAKLMWGVRCPRIIIIRPRSNSFAPQRSIMSALKKLPEYDWDEIRKHNNKSSSWIVIQDCVYDVTSFQEEVSTSWLRKDHLVITCFPNSILVVKKFYWNKLVSLVKSQVHWTTRLFCNRRRCKRRF